MIDATGTREVIVLDGLGVIVPATYHRAREEASDKRSSPIERARVGVLFLNSLSPSRAAAGDSAVYWADSIARLGYPTFRIDMPGFGDSHSDPPQGLLEFINSGGYASVVSAKAKEIVERFGLSGVVIVGLCAGAVSAIFAANLTAECKGLLLMDPYFHLPLKPGSKTWQRFTDRMSRTTVGLETEKLFHRVRDSWRFVAGNMPPGNANFPLLSCWRDLTKTGLPTILFRAPGFRHRGEFDYLKHVLKLAGRKGNVAVKTIEEANHTFSNRAGRDAVRRHIESWLATSFPLTGLKKDIENASPSDAQDGECYCSKSLVPADTITLHAVDCASEGG
jgi:pimeloyl-ACP methyl ester carboxylesterase